MQTIMWVMFISILHESLMQATYKRVTGFPRVISARSFHTCDETVHASKKFLLYDDIALQVRIAIT